MDATCSILVQCVSVTCSVNVQACVCHLFSTCASVCLSHVQYVCKCVVVTCSLCVQACVCHMFSTCASVCLSHVQYICKCVSVTCSILFLCKHVYVTRSLIDCYTLNGGFCDVTQSTLTERHALQLEWLFLWQCVEHQNTLCQMGAIPALSPLLTDGTLYKVSPQPVYVSFGPFIFSLLSAVCWPSATGCISSGLAATFISLKSVVIWGVGGYRLHMMCDFTSVFSWSFFCFVLFQLLAEGFSLSLVQICFLFWRGCD